MRYTEAELARMREAIARLTDAANALLEALENDDDPSGPAEELRSLIGRDG